MKRILGLDVGDKWIGVAISDPMAMIAQSLVTIKRESNQKAYDQILEIVKEYDISKIVVGLPKNLDNSIGIQSGKVTKFANKLNSKFGLEVIYIDERLSTVSAESLLIEANVRRENRKKYVDKIAATYILQTYLDRGGANG